MLLIYFSPLWGATGFYSWTYPVLCQTNVGFLLERRWLESQTAAKPCIYSQCTKKKVSLRIKKKKKSKCESKWLFVVLCGPATNLRLVQGVPCRESNDNPSYFKCPIYRFCHHCTGGAEVNKHTLQKGTGSLDIGLLE